MGERTLADLERYVVVTAFNLDGSCKAGGHTFFETKV
jgi:hypothetical protein